MENRIQKNAKGYAEPIKGKKGTFRLYFSLGKNPETGKYLRSSKKTYHCRSKNPKNWPTELDNALKEYRKELEGSNETDSKPRSVSDYADDFHRMRAGTMGSPLSYEREALTVRHIRELFGDTRLERLKPDDISSAYANARERGRFSDSEIRRIHSTLKQVTRQAFDNDLIAKDPCSKIKLPQSDSEPKNALSEEETVRLFNCLVRDEPSPPIVCTMILLFSGLRKGEALGLSWKDYDAGSGKLRVSVQYTNDKTLRAPKSKKSRRSISIDEILCCYLDEWRIRQKNLLAQLSITQNDETPIVHSVGITTKPTGRCARVMHMDGCNYGRWFRNFSCDNGFGKWGVITKEFERDGIKYTRGKNYVGLTPHGLRHTQATLLIGAGVDVKTVQSRLGHADARTTMNIYAKAIEANDRKASETFGRIVKSNN